MLVIMTVEPVEEVTRFVVGSTTKFLCLVGDLNSLMGSSARWMPGKRQHGILWKYWGWIC